LIDSSSGAAIREHSDKWSNISIDIEVLAVLSADI